MWWIFWVLLMMLVGIVCFFIVQTIVSVSDLELDANPIDICRSVNRWSIFEVGFQVAILAVFFFTAHWFEVFVNIPPVAWAVYTVVTRQYLLDATQIFRVMNRVKYINTAKLVFYMLLFFWSLFKFVVTLIANLGGDDDDGNYASGSTPFTRGIPKYPKGPRRM